MNAYELNIDGLVGPTHHYAGLAAGNLASQNNALTEANPQAAALQGLDKMQALLDLGLPQAFFPPHQRPNLKLLYQLGFTGSPEQQINRAARSAPALLSACYSASSMWAANAATVSASADCQDGRVHFTAANLINHLHRYQEAPFSKQLLELLFPNPRYFFHHPMLPAAFVTADEGAANHNRLCGNHRQPGISLFVYGKEALHSSNTQLPTKYPARQTLEASTALARSHGLTPEKTIFARQHTKAIDLGVFHHDVIGLANESVLLIHEQALADQSAIYQQLRQAADFTITLIEVSASQLSIEDAVSTYLFNSQLLTLPDGNMALIAPHECQTHERATDVIKAILDDTGNPIRTVHFIDLKQSMRNGGGPACLRLRVPLTTVELASMNQTFLLTPSRIAELKQWVKRYYRTSLKAADLADPALLNESFTALEALTQLLGVGAIYPFMRN